MLYVTENNKNPLYLPARFILAFLANIGLAIVCGLKVNINVTMVAMVNHSAAQGVEHNVLDGNITNRQLGCPPPSDTSPNQLAEDGPFTWSDTLQGTLLSSYFWGYMVSQIPLARLAEVYSAKWVFLGAAAVNVICSLLTPILTNLHFSGLIVMRVLQGVAGGAAFPAVHILIAKWAPQNERLLIVTLIYLGTTVGTTISIFLSGVISVQFGWEAVFYIMGGLSIIWIILWIFLVQDNPDGQVLMSNKERTMIKKSLAEIRPKSQVPWRKIFKSNAFWAILIAHTCNNFGFYMFLIGIPFYMKQVLNFNISKNALYSSIPHIPMLIFSISLSKLFDVLQSRQKIKRITARKISTVISTIVPGVCLVGMCFIGCLHYTAVVIMSVGIIAGGASYCGFLSNHMDISPNFAGTLMALTNTVATIPGIALPQLVGYITNGNQTIHAWRLIFGLTNVMYFVELVTYTIMATAEVQPWNDG